MVSIHMNMRILTPHIVVFSCSVILSVFQLEFQYKKSEYYCYFDNLPRKYLVFIIWLQVLQATCVLTENQLPVFEKAKFAMHQVTSTVSNVDCLFAIGLYTDKFHVFVLCRSQFIRSYYWLQGTLRTK